MTTLTDKKKIEENGIRWNYNTFAASANEAIDTKRYSFWG